MDLLLVRPFLSKNTNDEETSDFLYELAFDKYRHSTFTLKNDSGGIGPFTISEI